MFGSYLVTIVDQMCLILGSVANYDRKHLENSKIGLKTQTPGKLLNFFHPE